MFVVPRGKISRLLILACTSFVLLLWPAVAFTQKYSFTNYSIEDGLNQSQVTRILQDKTHHLVISTFLGMNRFDGKTFTTVATGNGITDFISGETIDHSGRIWYSNIKGLYCYRGDTTTLIVGKNNDSTIFATALETDSRNNVWGIRKRRLFELSGGHMENINVTGAKDTITAISISNSGDIVAAVLNKGLFELRNNKWISILSPALPWGTYIRQFIIGNNSKDPVYLLTGTDILSVMGNIAKKVDIDYKKDGVNMIYCITRDNVNGLWIGTNKGAYYWNNDNLKYFDESNGFTNNYIYNIFKDFDNNIWFGSNGAGIFRFDGDAFLVFDKNQGLTESILQIDDDKRGNILMTGGNKLLAYNGKKIVQVKIPSLDTVDNMFRCLYTDAGKNTWVVTQKQLFEKTGSNFNCFYPKSKNDKRIFFNAVLKDQLNVLWTITSDGCYYWDNGFKKIQGFSLPCTSLVEMGRDSILVGTRNGIFLVKNKQLDSTFHTTLLKNSTIMCVSHVNGRLYVGTIDNGLFVFDAHGRLLFKLDQKNGLNSISVYSIGVDKHHIMWVGTGRGINQFQIKPDGSLQKIMDENKSSLVVECNEEALLFTGNRVWIGTTKGMFVFRTDLTPTPFTKPFTTLQDVQFYHKENVTYTYNNGFKEPENLELPFDNSHITLSFNGIDFKNPRGTLYSYQLWPLDKDYCTPVRNNVVDYPSLPPGNYVFYVRSLAPTGVASNVASFSFEITPAYYQTAIFKVGLAILALMCGGLAWKYIKIKEERKRKLIAHLRLEEQVKIRKQTAEDFHDDLGNKLTRINVLSDLLSMKIDKGLPEQRKLLDQIKENAGALFTGSKHILWALDPDNDRLSEVLIHIKEFGIDFFLNTPVSFTSNLTDEAFKNVTLPMGYGRNITLILKELFNNTLRHADANSVTATAFLNGDNEVYITVEDDGKGFAVDTVRSGNGMRNIINRSKKIGAEIETRSSVGGGTTVTLVIKRAPNLF